jgi:hypothetical protein
MAAEAGAVDRPATFHSLAQDSDGLERQDAPGAATIRDNFPARGWLGKSPLQLRKWDAQRGGYLPIALGAW